MTSHSSALEDNKFIAKTGTTLPMTWAISENSCTLKLLVTC